MNTKIIFIPGNGGGDSSIDWFNYIKDNLGSYGIQSIIENFPDPELARKEYWLPFIKSLGADENTILIGHSSGAVAAMRYAEENKILGSVLVSACFTDLGIEDERLSGYYDNPWDWDCIRENQKWIAQFHSTDDPFIPVEEARFIHEKLNTKYFEFTDQGHFGIPNPKIEFPEVVQFIKEKLEIL
jgi:predicted alpha/beta hydrolase family esterase